MTKKTKAIETRQLTTLKRHSAQSQFSELSDGEVRALAQDIRRNGLRQRIEILPDGTIICGHQRVRALKLLNKKSVEVLVRYDLADAEPGDIERALIEDNLHRRQLDPLAKAQAAMRLYEIAKRQSRDQVLSKEGGDIRDRIGKHIGLSGRTLSRYWSILKTPVPVQEAFRRGQLSLVEAAKVGHLPADVRQQIARRIECDESPKRTVALYVPHRAKPAAVSEDQLRAFATALRKGAAALKGCTSRMKVDVIRQYAAELREGYAVIRALLRRVQPSDVETEVE